MQLIHLSNRTPSFSLPTLHMLRSLTLAYGWAIILSLISRVNAFLLLFPPEAGDTHGCFVDMRGCENKTQHPKSAGRTAHCKQSRPCMLRSG